MKKTLLTLVLIFPTLSLANTTEIDTSRYEKITHIKVEGIITPKVITFVTEEDIPENKHIILNEFGEVISTRTESQYKPEPKNFTTKSITASSSFQSIPRYLTDNEVKTTFKFDPEDPKKSITLYFTAPITSNSIQFFRAAESVKFAEKITIKADLGDGNFKNIRTNVTPEHVLSFPEIQNVHGFEILFDAPNQLIALEEINPLSPKKYQKQTLISFFAEEGKTYELFSHPHFGQKNHRPKNPQPISVDKNTPKFPLSESQKNPEFNPDFDQDGINDKKDLCPETADPKNLDQDQNGKGDICEDPDNDNIISQKDNCPFAYNPDQTDQDQDNIGDKCDNQNQQVTENMPYIFWVLFGIGALFLGVLVFRSLRN